MVEKKDFLVEIGTEELPPKALKRLSEAFQEELVSRLQKHGLEFDKVERFAAPRRLALRVSNLDAAQADQTVVRKGPAVKVAFDDQGNPTKAALGFARSCGVDISDIGKEESNKGAWLSFKMTKKGAETVELIPDAINESLNSLPIPKRMRWGDLNSEFVRPVHWIVLLLGESVIDTTILDVETGNKTRGHRFHHPEPITIKQPGEYEVLLRDVGFVEADYKIRKERVRTLAEDAAKGRDAVAVIDDSLLDEVTALTEWPVPVVGTFDEHFLEVPTEALIETMQKHQKYFPVTGHDNRLLPFFIAISNIESSDPKQVQSGNERVIRPRFKDAAFFWEQDLKNSLESMVPALDKVVFQQKLGTLNDKAKRIATIGGYIADKTGVDKSLIERSALLCKCDLLTNMVGEFAGLQGVMGRYYAAASGEDDCVAQAMEEQYLPRHAGDTLPESQCGQAIALADRIDSLVGIFAIGQKPTGVKDPYALRRASLGVLRILIETPIDLDLYELINVAAGEVANRVDVDGVADDVFHYILERLYRYYDDKGIAVDVVESVLSSKATSPLDIDSRIRAVDHFKNLEEASALAAANKRIHNIIKKNHGQFSGDVDKARLVEDAEHILWDKITESKTQIQPLISNRSYQEALTILASLRPSVDTFFDNVMVMSDDDQLKNNRLSLLNSLYSTFLDIADISRLKY